MHVLLDILMTNFVAAVAVVTTRDNIFLYLWRSASQRPNLHETVDHACLYVLHADRSIYVEPLGARSGWL